tara:strand:- start:9647 stop:10447 length:801 start_codon:yes stop_codon:yes gene_type:complete
MPIIPQYRPQNLSKSEFDERDRIVMGCAFASQNELGRLCDEQNYEKDVAARIRASGFSDVRTQVPIEVSHGAFRKEYRVDLIADDAMYELKTVAALICEHDVQVLNYAMMLNVNHGKLINFRPERVKGRLRFNAVPTQDRYRFLIDDAAWQPQAPECEEIVHLTKSFLADWGAYLDFRLYEQAIIFHFGGEAEVVYQAPMSRGGVDIGSTRFTRHTTDICFTVSGYSDLQRQRPHLIQQILHSPFRAMQWINFHQRNITFETLMKN